MANKRKIIDADNPPLTDDQLASMRPAREVVPEIVTAYEAGKVRTRVRGPQKSPTKVPVYMRLSPEVVGHFKAGGSGWQTRIDEALKKAIAKHLA